MGFFTLTNTANAIGVAAMHEVAVPAVRPAGAPEYADVSLRYGWVRSSFPSVEDAKDAIRDFHATRVDWFYPGPHATKPDAVYVTSQARSFINWCHANGMKIGGAMNTNTSHPDWRLKDGPAGRYIGNPRNVDYLNAAVAWGKAQIDAGVDTLVCDDFFYYGSSEKQLFSDKVIAVIQAYQPGFTIAGNSGSTIGTDYVVPYAFDFHYSDNNFIPDPSDLWTAAKAHRARQSTFLMHPNRNMTKEARRTLLALGYGVGAHLIAPWDEWLSGNNPRLFADPADFADLYGFARALGQLGFLNGYEDAAVGGYDLAETRYNNTLPIIVSGGSGSLSVFGRAQPGQSHAPIVFHLVESGAAQAATLRLRISALFKTSNVTATLYRPTAYNEIVHDSASTSGDYSALASASDLISSVDGDELVITVPAMNPWGALVIAPAVNSHSLNLSPATANILAGQTQHFSATVVDSSGNPINPQPTVTWTVTGGGSIDSSGLFTAGLWLATSTVTARVVLDSAEVVIGSQVIQTSSDAISPTVAYWNESQGGSMLVDQMGGEQTLNGGSDVVRNTLVNVAPFPVPNPSAPTSGGSGSIVFTADTDAAPGLTTGASVFQMTDSGSFTFEGWIQADPGATGYIASDRHQGNSYRGWFLQLQASGSIQFYSNSGGVATSINSSAVTDGSPHHFAAIWDHSLGQMRFYVDGALQGSSQRHEVGSYQAYAFSIGGRDGTAGGSAFIDNKLSPNTRLDELRFSNLALAPAQFLNAASVTYADYANQNGGSSTDPTADDNNNGVQDGLEYAFYGALGAKMKIESPGQLGQVLGWTFDAMGTANASDKRIKYALLLPANPPADVIYRVYASSTAPGDADKTLLATYSGGERGYWTTSSGVTMEIRANSEDVIVDAESPSTSSRRFVWLETEIIGL